MVNQGLGIHFQDMGIGGTLDHFHLRVPLNQRSYAWDESHVQTLFEDFSNAIIGDDPTYFLGTLVLTHSADERLEVADGQQRLATTSILIAAIRDYLEEQGSNEKQAAEKYTRDFLLEYDEMTGDHTPKLKLNFEDNDYFLNNILLPPKHPGRKNGKPTTSSHERLEIASKIAKEHVEKIIAQYAKADKAKRLYEWVKFLRESVVVIVIRVPDHINAFTMFETLNDRGLRASQADILKNYLFGQAQDRLDEVHPRWASMVGIIETIGDDDLLLTYLRHFWIAQNGPTVERELASKVKQGITGKQQAVNTVIALDEHVNDYTALLTPLEHMGWPNYDKQTRAYIYVITRVLRVEQIRPLLLAVVQKFEPAEAKKAFRLFLCWSVRFLVAGGGGGGVLDRHYGLRAKEVMEGQVDSTNQLAQKMTGVVRTDTEFESGFQAHRASKNDLARYYLRSLELCEQEDANPELGGIIEDTVAFNLEHILPQKSSENWAVPEETIRTYSKRLGNMVLLNPDINMKLGNKSFAEKRLVYAESPLLLTQEVGEYYEWGPDHIEDRQAELAKLALEIWSLK